MRTYRRNSPEAAARIVALVLISDGHVCRSEYERLIELDASRVLGLAPDAFPKIVHTLCEDLLQSAYGSGSSLGEVDADTLAALMTEVDDPGLRLSVLRLATAAAAADSHLADGEQVVLDAAHRHWGIAPEARHNHLASMLVAA